MDSSWVRVVSHDEPVPPPPASPALVTGYEPDRFQKFAIDAIEKGENVLVTARTGSGKTFVGEYQIAKSIQRGGRIFYTTPVKSLSNQKFHDLKKLFPEASVGIMTGDIKFRPDAQIIVMTTEILRNLLFKRGTATENVGTSSLISLDGLDAVIFDEVHYINDPDRGHVWEETLILLPPAVKLILLSATLSAPFAFAKWLGELKKVKTWLISTQWRAVPLEHCVMENDKLLTIYDSREDFHDSVYRSWLLSIRGNLLAHDKFKDKVKDARRGGQEGAISGKVRPKAFEHQLNDCLNSLQTRGNLPAIVFVFSRAGCERLADKTTGTFLDSSDSALVAHVWDFHLTRFRSMLEKSPQAWTLRALAMRGIAYHHSGLLPFLKEILEILFSKGLIKVLFATETFAVGINMPTKTVIFTALEKFTDGSIRLLKSSEYIQMAGRAGRRGKDDRGLVIYLPQRDPLELPEIRQILTGKMSSFGSRMNFHYDFFLKILNRGECGLIEDSYWRALQVVEEKAILKEMDSTRSAMPSLTEEERSECEKKEEIERRIQESQNSKKKAAQREFDAWKADHKESIWNSILARHKSYKDCLNTLAALERSLVPPAPQNRKAVLEEYGYVKEGVLTEFGRLASEVNEGHPFLMTELFLRLEKEPVALRELLTILSVFLGEPSETQYAPRVSTIVLEEIGRITADAKIGMLREERAGFSDEAFWTLNFQWVEPISAWLDGEEFSVLAAKYDIFEGNLQRSLMKLMGLVEEFTAMATLRQSVTLLKVLEGVQDLVLRGIVIAESLYLRI